MQGRELMNAEIGAGLSWPFDVKFENQVAGTNYQIPITTYQVSGTWYQVPVTENQVPGTRYQVLGD